MDRNSDPDIQEVPKLLPRPLSNDPRFIHCIYRYSHASNAFCGSIPSAVLWREFVNIPRFVVALFAPGRMCIILEVEKTLSSGPVNCLAPALRFLLLQL